MRIAVLSLRLDANYGGILQSYALIKVLEHMGHDVTLLDRTRKNSDVGLPIMVRLKRFVLRTLLFRDLDEAYRQRCLENSNTWSFVDKYIKRRGLKSFKEIREQDYDIIIVGSDQVWRPKYFESQHLSSIDNAFLSFTEGWRIKRIAYAASFGTDEWEYDEKQTKKCADLIKKFDAVSVREKNGIELCKSHFGVKVVHVLDPTLLLDKKDYDSLCNTTESETRGVFSYILDNNDTTKTLVGKASKAIKKPVFLEKITGDVQFPIEDFLGGFMNADFIVTDSFHACVFSIIYGKPFVVYCNRERGFSRINSFLKMLGLDDRIVFSADEFSLANIKSDVATAMEKLKVYRESSFAFLRNAIG